MSSSCRSLVLAVVLVLIATLCQVDSKIPPKFIRATRGASKAVYGTRNGYAILNGPSKLVVGATNLKREIGSPPASFHGRRVRRRKTVKKIKKPRRPSYSYGVPVYAKKYKYYAPSRPVRYKTRTKPVARLKLRLPTYTHPHDDDDYEEEDKPYRPDESYDYGDSEPQVLSVAPVKPRPRPVYTVVRKRKKKKRPKYTTKHKSTTPPSDDDEDHKEHEEEDDENEEAYKPVIKPRPIYEEPFKHHHKHLDSDGQYSQTPSYKDSTNFVPPYILTSNNYGHNNEHPYQSHGYYTPMPSQLYTPPSFTPPVYYPPPNFNPHQYRPSDTDIGFGQGMEYVADKNPSPWR